jgi:hypothetical protein
VVIGFAVSRFLSLIVYAGVVSAGKARVGHHHRSWWGVVWLLQLLLLHTPGEAQRTKSRPVATSDVTKGKLRLPAKGTLRKVNLINQGRK